MNEGATMKKFIFSTIIAITFLVAQSEHPFPPLNLVTIPTAGTLPKGSFTLEMLLQKDGGILPNLAVGLTDHFTIGMSYGFQDFIGDTKLKKNKPTPEVQVKYRLFEENTSWPALVIGLDTQGRGRYWEYDNVDADQTLIERYDKKAWGMYLTASKNWHVLGNLGLHIGISKNTWEDKDGDKSTNFFFGLDKELNRSFALLLEYDAALNDNGDAWGFHDITFGKGKGFLNAGLRWTIGSNLLIELDVNNITLNNDQAKYVNREVKIIYSEIF